jgi:hypothetical protein
MIPGDLVEFQSPTQLIRPHGIGQILLICKYEKKRILHLSILDDARKFRASLFQPIAVAAVNNEH